MAADDYNIISKHGKTTTASAVSPNSIKRPKERVPAKPDMPEVNTFIICQLCSGYLIDATAIIECQHTFCKSCILKYLETSTYCPVCDVQLNKGKPQLSLRSDVILQRLVYKLVPGLLVSEIRRRRDFSIKKGIDYSEAAVLASNSIAEEIETATDLPTVLTLDDVVSLSIEYYRSSAGTQDSTADGEATSKVPDSNGKQPATTASDTKVAVSAATQSNQKSNVKSKSSSDDGSATSANTNTSPDGNGDNDNNEQANDRRYLQCPAAVSVGLLKKFIRMKYGLSDDYRVDLLYNGNRDSILENDLTLVDVAFIFNWKNKEEPMNIHYRIFERPVKSVMIFAGMKRPAPSVMDEPPDDDTASGPHNRSSMFSSSSAPSSKLPRMADNTSTSGNQGSVRSSNTSGKSTTTSSSSSATTAGSLTIKAASNLAATNTGSATVASSSTTSKVSPTPTATSTIKVEKEDVDDEEEVDDDDEDEEEDYELVERKEHMKGIKSSRRLHNSIKESMKRSVEIASSNHSLRVNHVTSTSRSHSTDTKGSTESERELKNENSLNSGSSSSKRSKKKRGKSYENVSGKSKSGKVDSIRLRVSSSSSSSSEHTSDGSDNHQQHHHQPLKLSISTSGVTPAVVSSSACIEKKEPLKFSFASALANKTGSKSPERKHHKHKHHHHHHHKLRHRDKQGKGVTPSATVTNNSQKPLKLSFTLSPPSVASSQNQSQKSKQSQDSGSLETKDHKIQQQQQQQQQQPPPTTSSSGKGKPLASMHNSNYSARTSASAHGHLNNISKSISVSVNTNASSTGGSGNANTVSVASANSSSIKGTQLHGNKMLSPAELIPKNTGIEIQPTTIPISTSQISQQQQQHSVMQSASSAIGNNNSHKHSHPLLPDSVHVPKSVTLIPVNPNQMPGNNSNSGYVTGKSSTALHTGISSNSGVASHEKGSSGSQGNQNRINAHTFTHPITNKSLHQITVTEVPPPQQKSCNAVVVTTTSTTHSSISVSTSNPIEKVIANAANNKPQFNGPGSMEITKIYCGTASSSKENPTKKLKDRKGLDISITGTGFNVSVNKPTQNKLEEALRQKVNIAIGGGSGSISVTPAAPPAGNMSLLGQNMTGQTSTNSMNIANKIKSSVSTAAANLLSGKMPPGITIGPATVPPTSSSSNSGNISNSSATSSNTNITTSSTLSGSNLMKGLGFTLPPHLTAHPHIPNNMKASHPNTSNIAQAKSDKISIPANTLNTNNSRLLGKDSISIIGKGNVTISSGAQQQPPPVEITISASGGPGGKSQASISNNRGGINIVNKSKMSNDPLASIFDITQGIQRKSPTPVATVNNPASTKDIKGMQSNSGVSSVPHPQHQHTNPKSTNSANKRSLDVVPASGGTHGNNISNKKLPKESPELKRSRSASNSSEPDKTKQQQGGNSSSTGEIPLDLSGRSTRTTPPLIIPNPRESSKSPSEKPRKSPERAEKPGIVITPSTPTSNVNMQSTVAAANLLSSKMNVTNQKNSTNASTIPASEPFKGQVKSVSVSKMSPNHNSKISSIVENLAQKQAQAQQQQHLQSMKSSHNQQNQQQSHLQNMKNSHNQQQQQQIQQSLKNSQSQQHQHYQNMKNVQNQQQQHSQSFKSSQNQQQQQQKQQQSHHHHNTPANTASAKLASPNSSSHTHSTSSGSGNTLKPSPSGNSNSTKGSPSSSGLTSPLTASPGIPMTSPSPPSSGGAADHMRNLWTLSESANRQGKLNQMNELLLAANLFSPPGHPHSLAGAAAAHQLAAAAAAAVAASGSSNASASGGPGSAPSAFNSNMFAAQFGHHLAALGAANKLPPGMFDPHLMAAALNAHNAHAAAHAAGMRMHHPFAGSMSPPLNMPNAFFPPHGAPGGTTTAPAQQQQPSLTAAAAAGLKIPTVTSKQATSPGNNSPAQPGKSPTSIPFSPLFSHSVPVSSPKSPNLTSTSSSVSVKSPTSGSTLPYTVASTMPGSNTVSNTTTQHDQKHAVSHSHTSVPGKSSHHHQHHDSSTTHSTSHASNTGNKNTKINGAVTTPVFPPGIHNPLLPSRSSSSSSSNSNNSGSNFQSGLATTKTTLNKNFTALSKTLASSGTASSNPTKGAIPNSMKISNFLPSKPKDSQSDANAEATITSGFGIMPPLQAKPNFSLSTSRTPPNHNLIPPSLSVPRNPSPTLGGKEITSPISPVKGAANTGTNNKPSSMTCASLLRPDSLYSKPHQPSHHLLNSLNPAKGDHHQQQQQQHQSITSSSRVSGRAPSSDSVLLSPSTNKTTSPGASISNKSHNNKDGFRSNEATHQHHGSKSQSPTKELITSKKDIGSIPMGPAAGLPGLSNINFAQSLSSSPSSISSGLARPIPTIPVFLNRSSASSNPCTQSLHNMPLIKEGLQQKSTSPVKMSNNEQQSRSHLPSPVFFPFPGVSVPVQVKLQDENDAAVPAVTSTVTSASSLSTSSVASTHSISLKPEIDKLLAAKEEKMEESRKRSCSLDQTPSSNLTAKSFFFSAEAENSTRKIKTDLTIPVLSEESSNEIPPPTKIQKMEMQAETDVSSSVKNENTAALISKKCSSINSESSSDVCEKGASVKSESELAAQRESNVGEGEKIEKASNAKKGDTGDVVAGADPSKVFLSTPANVSACTTTAATAAVVSTPVVAALTESSCKIETATPLPMKAVEVSVETVSGPTTQPPPAIAALQSEKQTNETVSKQENRDSAETNCTVNVDITLEEKSESQIELDTGIPTKSDEPSIQTEVNRQESESCKEIPDGIKSDQIANDESVGEKSMTKELNKDNEDQIADVDVEMEDEAEIPSLGQTETMHEASEEMNTVVDKAEEANITIYTEMDVENITEKPVETEQTDFIEERVTLTKAADDEDVDVDVIDVGSDEPMEINTEETQVSIENQEKDESEEICIDVDNDDNICNAIVTSDQETNERDAMEVAQKDDKQASENELIELPQLENNSIDASTYLSDGHETTCGDTGEDMKCNIGEEKKDVEEEAERESKDPIGISSDVIKRQRLEETATLSQTEVLSPAQVEQQPANSEEISENQEENEPEGESTFLTVNEASNFSQDDSECGDLVIDLGPNAGENEVVADDDDDQDAGERNEENNENEAEALLTQDESNHSTVVQLEIKECDAEDASIGKVSVEYSFTAPTQEATETEGKLNEEPALPIMNSELIEGNEGAENPVMKSPVGEEKHEQDEHIGTAASAELMMTGMESSEPAIQAAHVFESLNQDSFLNQITINPASSEVNGVIKTDVDSEKSEESAKLLEDVAECPQVLAKKNVHDLASQSENRQEERGTLVEPSGNSIDTPEEDNKNSCETASAEPSTACGVMVESKSQLEEASPVNDATAVDSKNTADNNEPSSSVAVDDKKIEEEQQLVEQEYNNKDEEKQGHSQIAVLPDSLQLSIEDQVALTEENQESAVTLEAVNVIGDDNEAAPVHFPEPGSNVESSENISRTDDSSAAAQDPTNSVELTQANALDEEMEISMEVDEETENCDVMSEDVPMEEPTTVEAINTLTEPEIDDDAMQIVESDNTVTEINEQVSPTLKSMPDIADEVDTQEPVVLVLDKSTEDETEVPVISATITATSATIASSDAENIVLTPTTSTSSVAFKLDIAANDDNDAGKNVAASLLPSSVNNAATNSSSSGLIIPSSNNSSDPSPSSSSSSSPVNALANSTTGLSNIGSKSLETFGKVAAGLFASATNTINNNNNNTSLAPTTCDAISIATTNANA